MRAAFLASLILLGCSTPKTSPSPITPPADASDAAAAVPASDAAAVVAASAVATVTAAAPPIPEPSFDELLAILFADKASSAPILAACPALLAGETRIRCLYDERYRGDARAASIAHELWVKWRIIAGVEVAHTMDGGYRGMIRLEPAVPVGADRKHLEWVASAMADFDVFFAELAAYRAGPGDGGSPASGAKAYRFRPITLRFMRSIGARTPAAYAHDWTVAYNFMGTLNVSADAVRETMFHEIFHLNDAAHGDWSPKALGRIFDGVVRKCGVAIPCLSPYSPNDTLVRGGTYYSFQPGNGVGEYAAELALRYYREQRAVLRRLPEVKPFKCGPPENGRAWALMRDELFGGVDAVPACP